MKTYGNWEKEKMLVTIIFCYAVFEKTQDIAIASVATMSFKALTYCNTCRSVITEHIDLKLGICVHYPTADN